ncbi:MAG: NADH dehydrogenase, partial [Lentimonas sp.]
MSKQAKIVIVGAGFGGISLAKSLANKNVDVVLIDRNNYHTFQPLLYQVATGGLEPSNIAYPIRRIFRRRKNIHFRMAEVESVDYNENMIVTSTGMVPFDYLVVATGSTNNFFNFFPIKNSFKSLKTVSQA